MNELMKSNSINCLKLSKLLENTAQHAVVSL